VGDRDGLLNAKGWVHRDVKPDNVFGGVGETKIIDFAIAGIPTGFFEKLFHRRRKVRNVELHVARADP
jgi:serine/threonine protein kinase